MDIPLWKIEKIEKLCPLPGMLRKRRRQCRIGLNKFAKLARCSPAYLSRIETGHIRYVSYAVAHRIGKALHELEPSQ